jgi:hypothetical protein
MPSLAILPFCRRRRTSEGPERMRVQGRNQSGIPLRDFCAAKSRSAKCRPLYVSLLGRFFPGLAVDCVVFLDFSLAADSCFTLRVMASVPTLYVLAASRWTMAGFEREVASRMLVSTSGRESVPSSARRM